MEKTQKKIRAQTPETGLKLIYDDVLNNPVLNNYLREELYFKDEADEDGREGGLDYKHANDKVSPNNWDSNTVVLECFRVLQDLT